MREENGDESEGTRLSAGMIPNAEIAGLVAVLLGLYLISTVNFLLFHGIVELAGIAVAFAIFVIIWNTRQTIPDGFYLIIGISFLFIGSIDLVHTLAYKGMGVFPGNNPDIPTQLWIAARYFQSITFLAATFFIGRTITRTRQYDTALVIGALAGVTTLIFSSIFLWQNFPHCFIEGSGLTPFKIISEYVISAILVITIIVLYRKRDHFDPEVFRLLVAAQVFLILGEIAFTSYASVYGFMNMLGHLLRLLSVYFFYRAFVVIGLTRPYDLLLRQLKKDETALGERFKELNCLYNISALMEQPGISLPEILEKTAGLLPPAMQYPEISEARIMVDGLSIQTPGFIKTPWLLSREILVNGQPAGRVEVVYRETRPSLREGPFMQEEQELLHAVAERIGHIAERMRAEAMLRESEEKYRTLFETLLEGFAYCRMIYDNEGKPVDWEYLDVNRRFGELTGLADIKGKRVLEAIPNIRELTPELFETYGRVASTGIPEKFEIDFKPLTMWLRVSVSSPKRGYFVAVFDDITNQKQVEEKTRKARDFYLKVLDDFPNPIWRAGTDAKCDYFNRNWLAFTGRTLEQELGDGWAQGVHPEDFDRCLKTYLESFHARQPFEMEYRLRYHDGTYHWLFDSGKPFYTPDGEFAGYIGSCYDIQARVLAKEAQRQANAKLNLLSSITRHDIRNQLFTLKAYLGLSKESLEDPGKTANFIIREERAADAIERLIAFTKEYQDLGVKTPAWQPVEQCVNEAASNLPMREVTFEHRVFGIEVYADPLFARVFYNLIDNALRYGGDRLTSIRVASEETPYGLTLVVEDNGNGIAPEDRAHLFTKGFGKNTGLGLFLSREILSITNMEIRETGTFGKGARFEITVPKGSYRLAG